jgi:hypothetical protein
MSGFRAYAQPRGERMDMSRRLSVIFGVLAFGFALGGCTKCGPIWDDWVQGPKSCKSDISR